MPHLHLALWAKLGNETWPDKYHPVLCHLMDVGQVARQMWNLTIRRRVREWVTARLGLPDENAAGAWLAFWAATHDIGKVSPCFQHRDKRTEALRQRLHNDGFNFPVGNRPHGDISTTVLDAELESADGKWPVFPKKVAQNIAVAVGGHHGFFPTNWDQIGHLLGNDCWATARRDMLAELARLFGVTQLPPPFPNPADDQSVWMFVAGFTSVADWIGSNVAFFGPVGKQELLDGPFNVDDYFEKAKGQAVDALKVLGWLGRAETANPVTFAELFPNITNPDYSTQQNKWTSGRV